MDLQNFLGTLVAGGLGGTLSYWLLNKWPWFTELESEIKRAVAMLLNAFVAVLAYLFMIAMNYESVPIDWRAWVEAILNVVISLGATTYTISQVWHAGDLKKSRLANK